MPGEPKPAAPTRPLCLLLLPARLERFEHRALAEDLLDAPGAIAVEPAPAGTLRRVPGLIRDGLAATQARRMKLPGSPRALVLYDAAQYPLARALVAANRDAELWYGGGGRGGLHEAAAARAALTFTPAPLAAGERARERNRPLFERMESLGIESGRLGSERVQP
jgi:hypothetical protein